LHKFKEKEIYVYEAAVLDEHTMEPDAMKSLNKIEEALSTLADVEKGTICVDSGTDVWQTHCETIRQSTFFRLH